MSAKVKIAGSGCTAGISFIRVVTGGEEGEVIASRREPPEALARTLSRKFWQSKFFHA
jgi:hypothetical protein